MPCRLEASSKRFQRSAIARCRSSARQKVRPKPATLATSPTAAAVRPCPDDGMNSANTVPKSARRATISSATVKIVEPSRTAREFAGARSPPAEVSVTRM
ncbi:MAG: hypothetical protein U0271_42410 [Polyangiaceae bacterium]